MSGLTVSPSLIGAEPMNDDEPGGPASLDLEGLQRLADAATPGPWDLNPYDADDDLGVIYSPGHDQGMPIGSMFDEADAKLIVECRNAVPALEALVRRQAEQIQNFRALVAQLDVAAAATADLPDSFAHDTVAYVASVARAALAPGVTS